MKTNFQQKIFNDPIYGFISIPSKICFDIIEHPYFQRLRRIKQLGATHLVYPGALNTRFHHALGAMHLMYNAISVLRSKGHEITDSELESKHYISIFKDGYRIQKDLSLSAFEQRFCDHKIAILSNQKTRLLVVMTAMAKPAKAPMMKKPVCV